ncbi:MAG: hypothetical protein PHI06_08370 [Desulfobulbaceae bacterium]|nr:hypothetical protein [Desulfobulbaceae bacterium]
MKIATAPAMMIGKGVGDRNKIDGRNFMETKGIELDGWSAA